MVLDDRDHALIAALRRNARESLVSLARRVGLSRSATQERLRRLEREGVILGYTARLGETAGTAPVRALIAVSFVQGRKCDHVVPQLSGLPEIVACQSLAGAIDLMLTVDCASTAALDAIRDKVAATSGVATATTHVVLRTHFDGRA
ncbi:Lrp/AsnC family transcriptional regulator [Phreatobacter sp. AB_2022a]|uniref:Lrp/AsnC family transcriptional regulator n=1 Tax=Phreatobacter sp. AB_2022a TaxID=3003134 RepID=UPI002286DE2E|nr:Lrp/AsnC family transcriptional regulator [Phreatobacter sp. AB_2022a]MCZ0732616.1 Lrp/AsnC family transcriptional regulator [Phreatobacter sp. AB_2022a]